jgi:aminoglycoside 6'-N-acetyltransferase
MARIFLRKIRPGDKDFFAKWWRDKELVKLTSGVSRKISDEEVDEYFHEIFINDKDRHFMITADGRTIGHLSLVKRKNNWYETQIVIGEKEFWGKGYGPRSIMLLIGKARRLGIENIYLEVRPANTRAIRVYERCGFHKSGKIKYPGDKFLKETLRMELDL